MLFRIFRRYSLAIGNFEGTKKPFSERRLGRLVDTKLTSHEKNMLIVLITAHIGVHVPKCIDYYFMRDEKLPMNTR